MDKAHQAASPVIGPTSSIPPKLKNSHSYSDSPTSNNCNACHSPSQSIIGSSSRNISPFPYNADSMPDDVVLSKNGTKCVLHSGKLTLFDMSVIFLAYANASKAHPAALTWIGISHSVVKIAC